MIIGDDEWNRDWIRIDNEKEFWKLWIDGMAH